MTILLGFVVAAVALGWAFLAYVERQRRRLPPRWWWRP